MKKVSNRENFGKVNLFAFLSNFSVSSPVRILKKTWNSNLSYFVSYQFVNFFDSINKNRLKNIFSRVIIDLRVWREISKMFDNNSLNIRSDFFYSNEFLPLFDFLSFLLFSIYMLELDIYVFALVSKLCSRKILLKVNYINFLNTRFNKLNLSPLKFTLNNIFKFSTKFICFIGKEKKRDFQKYDLLKVK